MCAFVAKIQRDKVVRWCADGEFLRPVFSASRVQDDSDLHPKFALRPHHVYKYGCKAVTGLATFSARVVIYLMLIRRAGT